MQRVETAITKLTQQHSFPKAVESELILQKENLAIALQDTKPTKG